MFGHHMRTNKKAEQRWKPPEWKRWGSWGGMGVAPGLRLAPSPFPLSGHAQSSGSALPTLGSRHCCLRKHCGITSPISAADPRKQCLLMEKLVETLKPFRVWEEELQCKNFILGKSSYRVKVFTFVSHRWRVPTEGANNNCCVVCCPKTC